jgi:hypothetical protein
VECTHIRYRPEHVVPSKPTEALWEYEPFGEVNLSPTEFDEVTESNDAEHKRECESFNDV